MKIAHWTLLFPTIILLACSTSTAPNTVDPEDLPSVQRSTASQATASENPNNTERLEALWKDRTGTNSTVDYPIGPSDVIEVSVPAVDDLRGREVRVGADGNISLPLIGTVAAAGLTESSLRDQLRTALGKYMYSPQADVFVKEYHSRLVAVVGAVKSPGLVTLSGGAPETILETLTRAGGVEGSAADEVILFPGVGESVQQVASLSPDELQKMVAQTGPQSDTDGAMKEFSRNSPNRQPVIISLKSTSLIGGKYVNLPVRPGDVIVVPGGGDVMVTGWVQYPGHFPVGSGLTALGAISAAGGPMYAAATEDVKLIRTKRDGEKITVPIDLEKIQNGEQPDVPVRANDVIIVPYSSLKIGPYVFYNVLTRIGFGLPIPAL